MCLDEFDSRWPLRTHRAALELAGEDGETVAEVEVDYTVLQLPEPMR